MALNKEALKTAIKNAFDSESDKQVDPVEARKRIASKLADAIESFVKSGTVSTQVTGTCPAGAVTGIGQGNIS